MQEIVNLPNDEGDGAPTREARAVARPLPKPITRLPRGEFWRIIDGQIVGTAKALAIEQWALSW